MSWWDTKHITALASSALKNAQKKIDKVLDIQEDEKLISTAQSTGTEEFFNQWLEKKDKSLATGVETPKFSSNTECLSLNEKLINISSDKIIIDNNETACKDYNIIAPKATASQFLSSSALVPPKDACSLTVSNISAFDHFKTDSLGMSYSKIVANFQDIDINEDNTKCDFSEVDTHDNFFSELAYKSVMENKNKYVDNWNIESIDEDIDVNYLDSTYHIYADDITHREIDNLSVLNIGKVKSNESVKLCDDTSSFKDRDDTSSFKEIVIPVKFDGTLDTEHNSEFNTSVSSLTLFSSTDEIPDNENNISIDVHDSSKLMSNLENCGLETGNVSSDSRIVVNNIDSHIDCSTNIRLISLAGSIQNVDHRYLNEIKVIDCYDNEINLKTSPINIASSQIKGLGLNEENIKERIQALKSNQVEGNNDMEHQDKLNVQIPSLSNTLNHTIVSLLPSDSEANHMVENVKQEVGSSTGIFVDMQLLHIDLNVEDSEKCFSNYKIQYNETNNDKLENGPGSVVIDSNNTSVNIVKSNPSRTPLGYDFNTIQIGSCLTEDAGLNLYEPAPNTNHLTSCKPKSNKTSSDNLSFSTSNLTSLSHHNQQLNKIFNRHDLHSNIITALIDADIDTKLNTTQGKSLDNIRIHPSRTLSETDAFSFSQTFRDSDDKIYSEKETLKETPSVANLASSSSTIKDEVSLEGSLLDVQDAGDKEKDTDAALIDEVIVSFEANDERGLEFGKRFEDQEKENIAEESICEDKLEKQVECMIGEAMIEFKEEEKNGSSESSACLISPEHNSGHTSADEIETTTSSDIEIVSHISTPSQNKPQSPKPASQQNLNLHRRTDSGSSGQSLQSRNSDDIVDATMFKSLNNARRGNYYGDLSARQLTIDNEKILKKLAEVVEVLDIRERKLLSLSQENANLLESNCVLKSQLDQLETVKSNSHMEVDSMQKEFSARISDSEKKLKILIKERDGLKEMCQEIDIQNKQKIHALEMCVKEKEQMITELLEEGDKLSKQQLQTNSILKKLRSKEKESDSVSKQLRQKNDEFKNLIDNLEIQIKSKTENEKKHIEIISQLDENLKRSEEEISRQRSELEDAIEKARSLKAALDNSYKEISELHKARITEASETQKLMTNVEVEANGRLKQILNDQITNFKKNEQQLLSQIEELQLCFTRSEKDFKRKEDLFKQEISDLQQQLQEAESRNQELSQNVTAVTRPLLRQIENIQSSFSVQTANYEKIERSLSDRLMESQSQLASALEKERLTGELTMELSSKMAAFKTQVTALKGEKSELHMQLEETKANLEMEVDKNNRDVLLLNSQIKKLNEETNKMKKDQLLLENQIEVEKAKLETENKKYFILKEQLDEKEALIEYLNKQYSSQENKSNCSTPINEVLSRSNSHIMSTSFSVSEQISSSARTSLYESMRNHGNMSSTFAEHLQSLLQLREGEILQLQENKGQLERTRESMSKELVRQNIALEQLQKNYENTMPMQKQFQELKERYNAILLMYGEKVEEIGELKMDLMELKEIYRLQLHELLELKSHSKLED